MTTTTTLTLRELESYDPSAPDHGGRERRFCCPLPPCDEKRRDASHRSLALNTQTGAWCCHRCGAHGKLKEWWDDKPREDAQARARRAVRRTFSLPGPPPPCPPGGLPPQPSGWREQLRWIQPLRGTAGERYVEKRGIPIALAHTAGVRFSPDWCGRMAVVFPVRDAAGALVGAQGRYIDGREDPKTRSIGTIRRGVFATPGAFEREPLLITEAPLDALTLAAADCPAIALIGTAWPDWLVSTCAFRRVFIATDADAAGDRAAQRLEAALCPLGARVARLRPWQCKDWNELAPQVPDGLKAALTVALTPKAA